MKISISLIVLSFCLHFSLSAQNCQIPNSSFEEWEDITFDIDTSGTLPAETVFAPVGYFPFVRILFSALGDALGSIVDIDIAQDYLGVERSDDASDGSYSLKMGGNSLLPLSDAISFFECDGELPSRLSLDLKHVGNGADTLTLIMTFGENLIIPIDPADVVTGAGYTVNNFTADQTSIWSTLNLDIIDNNNGMSADSIFLWLITTGDEEYFSTGEESYFLIDNLVFDAESSIAGTELSAPVNVYPMPFIDKFYIDNSNEDLDAVVYDLSGRKITSFDIRSGVSEYDLSTLNSSGNYILEMRSTDGKERSSYNIIKK